MTMMQSIYLIEGTILIVIVVLTVTIWRMNND